MDTPLVALNPNSGALLGQWRLADPFLSIRHLAWDASARRLGIALQAEHPIAKDRWRSPVFAVWDGERLTPSPEPPNLYGYGGAVAAGPSGGFLVGCTRANAVAVFDAEARWSHNVAVPEVSVSLQAVTFDLSICTTGPFMLSPGSGCGRIC